MIVISIFFMSSIVFAVTASIFLIVLKINRTLKDYNTIHISALLYGLSIFFMFSFFNTIYNWVTLQ